ncbi:MAG: hypothetical protein GWP08_07160, partial [Nitrospiraceae bacterium]|nr:hypothetical protein [Nitrospiraceae bacterium]
GNYHGYATLHYGYFKTIVAHFVPADGENWTEEKPIGRWRFEKVLAGDLDRGDYAYESNVVVDEDGTLYFLYDAGHPREAIGVDIHIKAHKMLDPANLDPDFAVRPILSPEGYRSEDRNHPGSSQIVEGTFIQRVQGKYVLLYSVGDYLWPNYKLGVAYSDTLIPKQGATYQKPRFEDPENLWGNSGGQGDEIAYLMQSQSAEWPNFAGNELDGPGIGCLVHTDAGHRLVFHARKRGENERRIWTIPVNVQIGGGRPSNQWMTVGE